MEQEWFELQDVRRRKFDGSVWIPLRAVQSKLKIGTYGHLGYRDDFFGAGSIAVPLDRREEAEKLGWMDIGISHQHSGYFENNRYKPCDIYEANFDKGQLAIHLVLDQLTNRENPSEWHLHQDLVLTLGLKREGDIWLSPNEGYIEVARLNRNQSDGPQLLEFRAEHLKDYLCARNMALYITSYFSRKEIVPNSNHIAWPEEGSYAELNNDRWEGRVTPIHEGGHPFGAETAVFHVSRTDVDPEEDVPSFDFPGNDSIESRSWVKKSEGRKIYRVEGEFWRNEWVEPAAQSPRIKLDESPPTVYFITDSSGQQENKTTLVDGSRWLWFRPEAMMELAHRRGGALQWYSRYTGNVRCSPNYDVQFGVNGIGLVNVYAKDIGLLPNWQQRIWAGFNVGPEGKVSDELLASQMKANPANTQAPEAYLGKALEPGFPI